MNSPQRGWRKKKNSVPELLTWMIKYDSHSLSELSSAHTLWSRAVLGAGAIPVQQRGKRSALWSFLTGETGITDKETNKANN